MANTLKYLALSTITKPFDDVRVRQAIAYAFPYQKVNDRSVFGRAEPVFGASSAAPTDASWPQPFPYSHDPDKARSLLRDAGLGSGFDTKLFFDAQVATTDEPAALVIQDELGKLGIWISPVLTTAAVVFSFLISANVVVEKVFAWPGIGSYALEALVASDYAAVQGFVLAVATLYVLINVAIDILYGIVDVRVRLGG